MTYLLYELDLFHIDKYYFRKIEIVKVPDTFFSGSATAGSSAEASASSNPPLSGYGNLQ